MRAKNLPALSDVRDYRHPMIAATRGLSFADHVTKRNGASGDENEIDHNMDGR